MYNLVCKNQYTGGIFMFENILTKETISFKDLEEIAFKIACEFANEILRNMFVKWKVKCNSVK